MQVEDEVHFHTARMGYRAVALNIQIEYRKMRGDLIFGYEKAGSLLIASRAKAVLDTLYVASFGKASVTLEDLDLSRVPASINRLARKYPGRTQRLLKEVLNGSRPASSTMPQLLFSPNPLN